MSKDAKIYWTIFASILAVALFAWFLTKVLEIMRENPQPLWFILGVLSTIAVEGIIYWSVHIFKRMRP